MDVCYYINSNIDGNGLLVLPILNPKIPEKIKASFLFCFSEAEAVTFASANFPVNVFDLLICQEANHLHPHYLLPAIDY